jgi:hypothetical protein
MAGDVGPRKNRLNLAGRRGEIDMRRIGRFPIPTFVTAAVAVVVTLACTPSRAQLVDDIVGFVQFTRFSNQIPLSNLNVTAEFPTGLIIDETNLAPPGFNKVDNPHEDGDMVLEAGEFDPDGDGDIGTTYFERNEHFFFFQREGGSLEFNRHEGLDLSYNFTMETPHHQPRKEAGLMFRFPSGQNAQFIATSNNSLFDSGEGEIAAFAGIPGHNFSGVLGDYDHGGAVDAADYVLWRKTLGTRDDGVDPPENMVANGDNEGESEDFIDAADYEVWRMAFGKEGITFNVNQTIFMRLIYTPPVLKDGVPFNPNDPGANVETPGTMEYMARVDNGPLVTSGPLDFTNAHLGLPNGTSIVARTQFQAFPTPAFQPDSAKISFTDFDLNGPAPGNGFAANLPSVVPEPCTSGILGLAIVVVLGARMRGKRSYNR